MMRSLSRRAPRVAAAIVAVAILPLAVALPSCGSKHSAGFEDAALTEIGMAAADCLARAIARGVYAATALPFAGAVPAWRDKFPELHAANSL